MGMGTLPLTLAVWCMLLERSSAGGLFQSSDLRAVTWRACTLSAATRPVSMIPKINDHSLPAAPTAIAGLTRRLWLYPTDPLPDHAVELER